MKDKLKVLAINGSPHADGGTFQAINIVAKELEKFNIETEILQIGNKVIQGCRGCGTCKKGSTNGLCVFNDDEVNIAIDKYLYRCYTVYIVYIQLRGAIWISY